MKESKTMRVVPEPPAKTTLCVPHEGLIVKHPTGVWWEAQAGGVACTHPKAEGFFIPLTPDPEIRRLLCRLCCGNRRLGDSEIEKLAPLLKEDLPCLEIDRNLSHESTEGWLHVKIDSEKAKDEPLLCAWIEYDKSFPFDRAVLVCTNCD
jgi:uncharacterized protein DUF6210